MLDVYMYNCSLSGFATKEELFEGTVHVHKIPHYTTN